jgi:uncharacterized RDD family membrane protein YckC
MPPATRMQRFLGALADGVIVGVPYLIGSIESIPDPIRLLGVVASLGLLVAQIYLVSMKGQTIGKRLVGTRIVRKDTLENGGFVINVLWRGFLNGLLSLIPLYFLADCLFIFREDRRCIHDMLAGTIVVQAEPDMVQ